MIKGIGRFEKEASFATEGVVTYVESSANGDRKRPLWNEEIRRISTIYCLIYMFLLDLRFIYLSVFFGLAKYDIPFFVFCEQNSCAKFVVNSYIYY